MSHIESTPMVEDTLSLTDAQPGQLKLPSVTTLATTALASATLVACGGGDADPAVASDSGNGLGRQSSAGLPLTSTQLQDLDAWRFFNQATFGPTQADLTAFKNSGYNYSAWLNAQFAAPKSMGLFKLTEYNYNTKIGPMWPDLESDDPYARRGYLNPLHASSAWWEKALTHPDQLRARVAFALSEIFVVSMSGTLSFWPYMVASYYDVLLDGAFGNYKDLLLNVAGHPAMGLYLSHMSNRKPSGDGTRIPDQNFAREVMQLFSIGLYKLNMDGSLQLDPLTGKPTETYTPYDVEVLSHVFTGWGWQHLFEAWFPTIQQVASQTTTMKPYPSEHSTFAEFPKKDASGKVVRFPNAAAGTITLLGKTLTISATSSPEVDRQAALNILFTHQNVAPFMAKQMIQRLVTSNPSKAYVGRVAKAFKDSGLSLKALVNAILLDTEARNASVARSSNTFGKLREPLLRVTQFMRAFQVKSVGNKFHVASTQGVSGGASDSLGQSPIESPSVFNFFRPGYVAPNTQMGKAGLVTPEMQTCSETEVAAYINFMEVVSHFGMGAWVKLDGNPVEWGVTPDAEISQFRSVYPDFSTELTATTDPLKTNAQRASAAVAAVNAKLFGGGMSTSLQTKLLALSDRFGYDADTSFWSQSQLRMSVLAYVAAISPEYVVQR